MKTNLKNRIGKVEQRRCKDGLCILWDSYTSADGLPQKATINGEETTVEALEAYRRDHPGATLIHVVYSSENWGDDDDKTA